MYPLSVVLFTISLFMVELYFLPASESYVYLPMYMYTDKLYSLRLLKYNTKAPREVKNLRAISCWNCYIFVLNNCVP